ncbi:MAG: ketose-bisphosphate aldolase [Clostridiales bacterium]|nr:ketose-bisphosphate aldolase [Clostridiales bacterium]
MELQNSNEIFKKAIDGKYAIGAFNFVNMEVLKAIIEASNDNNSPVIVQCSTGAIKYAGVDTLVAMAKSMAKNVNIPICLNLDHGKTFEDCKMAIDAGFTNVMIDASSLPYEENIALTKRVVEYAHSKNVTVEAELGVLAGVEEDISASHNIYTDPDQAYDFVKRTGIDSLAIAIGTSHGTHKFKGDAILRLDILAQIEEKLPTTPLVLHGASTVTKKLVENAEKQGVMLDGANGVPENMLSEACSKHICKVNVDSDLKIAYTTGIRKHLNENAENVDIRKYNTSAMEEVKKVVAHKIQNIFNSKNMA